MSSNSTLFENPFRAGGQLSKDADDIIDAIKTGKLSVISNSEQVESQEEVEVSKENYESEDEKKECLVKPIERKNGVIAVQQVTVVNIKQEKAGQEVFEDGMKKKKECCVLLWGGERGFCTGQICKIIYTYFDHLFNK